MRRVPIRTGLLLSVLFLAAVGCSSDDEGGDTSPETTAAPSGADPDTETTTSLGADTGDGLGSVEVDGETFVLTDVTGITSCNFDDPSGNFAVAAESADGDVFVRLDVFADDPSSNEFSVAVGEVEYVSETPDDVVVELDAPTVSGTIAVEPLFEEGTAQDVIFEITCPA